MAISPKSHRKTTGIYLHERTSTFISNVLLHPRAGGSLKYDLLGVLKESAFEGVLCFPVKKGKGFYILHLEGPLDSSGRWNRLSVCWQWPTHAAGQGLVRRDRAWFF